MLLGTLILVLVFFVLVMLDVPIAVAIGLASVCSLLTTLPVGPAVTTTAQRLAGGLDSFTLLAIPFFVLSGYLMGQGGIARRLVAAAKALIGTLPGGLALVNIVSCMLFGAISGSAIAATSAIGTFMIPQMKEEGYEREYSTAVTITGSVLGLLIPPSNVLIVYAVAAGGVSIAALFMAGYLPGLLCGLFLMIVAALYSLKKKHPTAEPVPLRDALKAFGQAGPSIAMIFIVVGGIIAGVFTATEASAIAVLYALILSMIYREVTWRELPEIILKSVETTAMVLLLIGVSTAMAWVLAYGNIPALVSESLLSISDNPLVILLLINLILLFVGAFLDITPAILIFTPIFLPVAIDMGMSPLHFGIMLVLNLSIGVCTPPVGSVLFVGCAVGQTLIQQLIRPLIMLYLALLAGLLLVTYIPFLSEALPQMSGLT